MAVPDSAFHRSVTGASAARDRLTAKRIVPPPELPSARLASAIRSTGGAGVSSSLVTFSTVTSTVIAASWCPSETMTDTGRVLPPERSRS